MPHENSATTETPITKQDAEKMEMLDSPFCQSNCKVCNSPYRELIFEMMKEGKTYRDISTFLKENHNENISISSISRHKQNYSRALRTLSNKLDYEKFNAQAENVSVHQKQVLFLMKASFKQILEHLNSGSLVLSIDDYEKLTKLYYNVVQDPDSADDGDIVALFQKASKKQGFDIEQGILFKSKSKISE
jgi:hypothetical protein